MKCKHNSTLRREGLLTVLLVASISLGRAQQVTARLDGTVTDTAGAVVVVRQ
jgi:hypothetical protein